MKRFAVLAGALLLAAALSAQEEGEEPALRVRTAAEMPKVASSSDRFVQVVAADVPGDAVGFRLPILQFTTRLLRDIERVYRLEMPRGEPGLVIHALDGRTNDVRVVSRRMRRGRHVLTRIWLPSPGFSDLDALRFSVAKAYFGAWIDRNRDADVGGSPAEMPDWMILGALRGLDSETVDADKRTVLEIWSQGRLPYFSRFCGALRTGTDEDGAFCGYVVSWMREKKIFRKTLDALADGRVLTGTELASALTGERSPELQDRVSDERLARLTRSVLTPGRASAWDLKVFTSRLLLYSTEFDKNIGPNGTSCTFREAIALAKENPDVREAAWRKALEMPFCAIGRGPALAEVSEKYRRFLTGVARGEGPDALTPLLDEAEAQMQEILNEDRKDDNR